MKKRIKNGSRAAFYKLFVTMLLFAASVSLIGCASAGDETLITTTPNAETGETETSEPIVLDVALTDEEAEQDHLTLTVSNNVTIDAVITPRSLYADGVGMWEPEGSVKEENGTWELCSYEDLLAEDMVRESTAEEDGEQAEQTGTDDDSAQTETGTADDVDSASAETVTAAGIDSILSEMAEAFGKTWLTAYEEALEKQEWDEETGEGFFIGRWTENAEKWSLGVLTPGCYLPEGAYDGSATDRLYYENEELDFLPVSVLTEAAEAAVKALLPGRDIVYEITSNTLEAQQATEEYYRAGSYGYEKTLAENAKEYYFLEFYDTIEGIPIKRCNASWKVDADTLAVNSYYYGSSWVSSGISYSMSSENCIAMLSVTESGFDLSVEFGSPTGYEMLYDPQPVVDINEILESACETLVGYDEEILVTNIELVMANKTVEEEDGTWLVYAPFWKVDYYRWKTIGGQDFFVRYQMVFDGYTGEMVTDDTY